MAAKHNILAVFCLALWLLIATGQVQAAAAPQAEVHPIPIHIPEGIALSDAVHAALSADGRLVLYTMRTSRRSIGERTLSAGIYLYDRVIGTTLKIADLPAWEVGWWPQVQPRLSRDGRFIFYETATFSDSSSGRKGLVPQLRVYDRFWGADDPLFPVSQLDFLSPGGLTVSHDGRYLAFTQRPSDSSQLGSPSSAALSIYDRLNAHTYHIGEPTGQIETGLPALEASPVLSGDSRTLVFLTTAAHPDSANPEDPSEIVVYNRVLDTFRRFPLLNALGGEGLQPVAVEVSHNAGVLVLQAKASESAGGVAALYRLDPQAGTGERIPTQGMLHAFQLSADGRRIAYTTVTGEGSSLDLHILDLVDDTDERIVQDILALEDISAGGNTVAFRRLVQGRSQVFCWQQAAPFSPAFTLAGRVVDSTGHPLALVTVTDSQGSQTRTDGEGIFWLSESKPGAVTLRVSKEGFRFEPGSLSLELGTDQIDLHFIYAHDETLEEARKDLGMPYSFERGASGPFHGYSAGYCTDLVLDAYTWGVDFNIQFALEQDFRANPWHFYRWRDARNAHDMWRYFAYTDQLQPHSQPYQPGDIVFFDWSEDGEIDHVAIVSEVNNQNRPRRMLDASGITNANPSGVAAELPWEAFHERTVRGFARWSGKYQPVIVDTPADQVLQVALGGSGLVFWMVDPQGRTLSPFSQEIPGGKSTDFHWEQTLSILNPLARRTHYLVILYNPGSQPKPYQFTTQVIQQGWVNDRFETKGSLRPGAFQRFSLTLDTSLGVIIIHPPENPVWHFQDRFKDLQ